MTKIFLDLDGVFADFDKRVSEIIGHGWDRKSNEIWGPLSKQYRLFWHLDLIPDALRIITFLKDHDLEFLTALPEPTGGFVASREDKIAWVRHHISRTIKVNTVVGGKNKPQFLAQFPGAVLIDDYDRNIKLWNEAGGVGVLHETYNTDGTIGKLEALGFI